MIINTIASVSPLPWSAKYQSSTPYTISRQGFLPPPSVLITCKTTQEYIKFPPTSADSEFRGRVKVNLAHPFPLLTSHHVILPALPCHQTLRALSIFSGSLHLLITIASVRRSERREKREEREYYPTSTQSTTSNFLLHPGFLFETH